MAPPIVPLRETASMTCTFRSALSALVFATIGIFPAKSLDADDSGKSGIWNVIEIDEINYVSTQDIERFFRFSSVVDDNEGKAAFKHRSAILELDEPNQEIRINQIRLKPCFPLLLSKEGKVLASTTDLSLAIDPILRPSKIKKSDGELAEIRVEISTAEGFDPPISSPDPVGAADACIYLHLESTDGPITLKTAILTPAWINDDGGIREKPEPMPGNEFDKLNAAMAAACHSHLLMELLIAEDLGIHRSRHPQLAKAERPVIRITLSTPDHYQQWSKVSKSLVNATTKFQKAVNSR
jgi:hypothetical protein